MKLAETWLRDWVDPDLDSTALAHQLTMLGHEVDDVDRQGDGIDGVIIAEVLEVARHPDADRLSVCRVSTGEGAPVEVVCGAPNVRQGMKSPLATPGVVLPGGIKLRKSKIRGVVSNGMLCSAVELGLGEESDGIIDLPADAPVGEALADYLALPDTVFDIDLTPNRGDCFSVLGIARDVAALTGAQLRDPAVAPVAANTDKRQAVELVAPDCCPVFAGRVIRGIRAGAQSPLWMVERLRRAGLRAIHPVVDVTNYVMLELGQPLHGYDHALIRGTIRPRLAHAGERLTLLDGKEIELEPDTIVVTDDSGPIGLGGIMGGLSTAVTDETRDVFFEAAFWPPGRMAGRARSYGLHTDASLRFERGVDPRQQGRAVERASQLLIEIAGGEAGPLVVTADEQYLPERDDVPLRRARLARLLGVEIADEIVESILQRLGFEVRGTGEGWSVTPPSYRFDIALEADLIEEVARIHGYDSIPESTAVAALPLGDVTESRVAGEDAAALLVARDYQEVITYSFISTGDDEAVSGQASELTLSNPISLEMSVMRSSLWPGMLHAAAGNLARQQDRVRLFELGTSFHGALSAPEERLRVAGLVCGSRLPEHWDGNAGGVDFFDIKGDVSALLALSGRSAVTFRPLEHPALQPGQAAAVLIDDQAAGVLGKLHPALARRFGIKSAVYLFELDADVALGAAVPKAVPVSRYPSIRRDIAVLVNEKVSAQALVDAVRAAAPALVKDVRLFDIYQGAGIEAGLKSVAIGLILQETSRTLTDQDADAAQTAAIEKLYQEFAAVLRD